MGSPPCTAFSRLQALNKKRRPKSVIERELEQARQHIKFVVELYRLQVLGGRYYLHAPGNSVVMGREGDRPARGCARGDDCNVP